MQYSSSLTNSVSFKVSKRRGVNSIENHDRYGNHNATVTIKSNSVDTTTDAKLKTGGTIGWEDSARVRGPFNDMPEIFGS